MSKINIYANRESLEERFLQFGAATNSIVNLDLHHDDQKSALQDLAAKTVTQIELEANLADRPATPVPAVPVWNPPQEHTMYVIRKDFTHKLLTSKMYIGTLDAEDALKALTQPADRPNYTIVPVKVPAA